MNLSIKNKRMPKIRIIIVAIFLLAGGKGYSQIGYELKVEGGFLKFLYHTVTFEPPGAEVGWKGYNLENRQNGIDINTVHGITYKKKLFAGIGFGYLNFEGINGASIFSDIEYLPLKTKLTPLINLKIGYNHIWNQYEKGTGTGSGELNLGLNYKLNDRFSIYIKSGYLATQQSWFIPVRAGFRFRV